MILSTVLIILFFVCFAVMGARFCFNLSSQCEDEKNNVIKAFSHLSKEQQQDILKRAIEKRAGLK